MTEIVYEQRHRDHCIEKENPFTSIKIAFFRRHRKLPEHSYFGPWSQSVSWSILSVPSSSEKFHIKCEMILALSFCSAVDSC